MQFHRAIVVALKFIAISKECKSLYQLISREVQNVIHLMKSLSDEKYSYQLSSIQACCHNLCLYARRRAALCAGDAAFPSLAIFSTMWVIFRFWQRPLLEFAVLRRVAFSLLMACRVSKHNNNSAKLWDAAFKMHYKNVSSNHSCNQFWKYFMYSFVLLIGAPKKLCRLNKLKCVCQSFENISTVWSNCCGLSWTR